MDARFSPMLATAADAIPTDVANFAIEPKIDGWRTIVHIDETVCVYGGRNGKTYTGQVPYIEQALTDALPKGTAIDGELMCGNAGWSGVQGVMTRSGAHRPSALSPALTLVVFDILLLRGQDVRGLPFENRRSILEMIEWPNHTYLVPNGPASLEQHIEFVELGMEGSVLKRLDSRYASGRRDPAWLKLKTVESDDCEIIGFKPGENGRSGEVGAIIVRLPSGEETTASGMTDKVRADMLANPQNYLGKLAEIAHNGRMSSGKVRHPRFMRIRDDKAIAPVPTAPKPAPKRRAPRGPAMRAYHAMGTSKLRDCLSSLECKYGDAYERVINGRYAGTLDDHLAACRKAAREKGVI